MAEVESLMNCRSLTHVSTDYCGDEALRWLHRVLLNVDARASVMFLKRIFDVSALQDD